MLINVVNPNTTASMTRTIAAAADAAAMPGTRIRAVQPAFGPPSIEGAYDDAFAVPGLLAEIAAGDRDGAAAHVIACFDDTGLEAARTVSDRPVIGIGEAGFLMACVVAHRFAVVTTLWRSVPVIENNLLRYGFERRCARVRATDIPVLALEDPASGARARISAEIAAAITDDRADAVVLGCAGMADLARSLGEEHGVPVIDGVAAAVALAQAMASIGLATAKRGGYARPVPKDYAGLFAGFSPRG